MLIIKRDGKKQKFKEEKIKKAIKKAYDSMQCDCKEDELNEVVSQVVSNVSNNMKVEEIQDIVVGALIAKNLKVGIAYQTYRTMKNMFRNSEERIADEVGSLYNATNEDVMYENTNKDSNVLSTQRDLMAGIVSRDLYVNKYLPKHIAEAHKKGEIHIHDTDFMISKATNCGVYDFAKMLKGGCFVGNADLGEPNSFEVAKDHLVQMVACIASNTYGGTSIPYFDKTLVPYVRKSFIKHFNTGLKYFKESTTTKVELDNEDYFDEKRWNEIFNRLQKSKNQSAFGYAKDMTLEAIKQGVQGFEYEVR